MTDDFKTLIELERMVETLEDTGDFKVLRRLKQRAFINAPDGTPTMKGLLIDTEATGLDTATDEIIEFGLVAFEFDADGRIYSVGPSFSRFNQPSGPIPEHITEITGITDEMVAGHSVAEQEIADFIDGAVICIAHNAAYDRPLIERYCAKFKEIRWACSMSQIDWKGEGLPSARLGDILSSMGYFHNAHRAADDCFATIEILAGELPKSGGFVLRQLIEATKSPTCRIWAEQSPFEAKDELKKRGYFWNGDNPSLPRSWFRNLKPEDVEAEQAFLRDEIYKRDRQFRVDKISALDRFSNRA